jgi:hypothetical protein
MRRSLGRQRRILKNREEARTKKLHDGCHHHSLHRCKAVNCLVPLSEEHLTWGKDCANRDVARPYSYAVAQPDYVLWNTTTQQDVAFTYKSV